MKNNIRILSGLKECFWPAIGLSVGIYFLVFTICFGVFFFDTDLLYKQYYFVPISANRMSCLIDSVAQRTINKPQFAIKWEEFYRKDRNAIVLYLPNAKACVKFGIESANGGAKLTPWECQINPEYRMFWIGSPGHGVTFCKAHQMEKDFEEYVLKKNNIPFEKHKPFSSYLARLMMYPLAFMWQTFLFIFVLVFTWIYFERSKRWKQEK